MREITIKKIKIEGGLNFNKDNTKCLEYLPSFSGFIPSRAVRDARNLPCAMRRLE